MIPLNFIGRKICQSAVTAGHLDADGSMPHCYGQTCSCYYQCTLSELQAAIEIEKLTKTALSRRIIAELEAGKR